MNVYNNYIEKCTFYKIEKLKANYNVINIYLLDN